MRKRFAGKKKHLQFINDMLRIDKEVRLTDVLSRLEGVKVE